MYKRSPPPFLWRYFVNIWKLGIENWSYGKLEPSLLSLNRNLSKVSLINSQKDSNLFFIEFISRCPGTMFLGFFRFVFCKFLKASALESFFTVHSWDSNLPNLFLQKLVLLSCAFCQLSNMLKAN